MLIWIAMMKQWPAVAVQELDYHHYSALFYWVSHE